MRFGAATLRNDGHDALVDVADQLARHDRGSDDHIGRRRFGGAVVVQAANEPLADVEDVSRLVTNHRDVAVFERVVKLDGNACDGGFGRLQVFMDLFLDPCRELRIAQNRRLGGKNAGILRPAALRRARCRTLSSSRAARARAAFEPFDFLRRRCARFRAPVRSPASCRRRQRGSAPRKYRQRRISRGRSLMLTHGGGRSGRRPALAGCAPAGRQSRGRQGWQCRPCCRRR